MLLNFLVTIINKYGLIIGFVVNLCIFILLLLSFYFVKKEKLKQNKINDYLGDITKTVNSIRYGDLSKKILKNDIPNAKRLTDSLNRMIETLHDRESMINEYQHELARQNKMLEATINSLSDGLIITNSDGKILRVTQPVANWLGIPEKKIIGKQLIDYIQLDKKRPLVLWNNSEAILLNDKSVNVTVSTLELNLDERNKHYIVVLKNVTDQKELENLKEDFVATLTHDLKVPIIAETNMIELFLNENFGEISEKQRLALKNMQSSNKELLELVQTVLDTYKIGKLTLYKESIMLQGFLKEIISEMSPIASKTNNTLKLCTNRNIRVYADKFQLTRVIKNLIQNALLYGMPKTPVEISIGEIPKYITIKVKDYGAGIPKDEIDKIFNKYYSASKKFKKIGTGLGLYLAFQIVKAHDGELTVESKEGEYTEFCIKIPA